MRRISRYQTVWKQSRDVRRSRGRDVNELVARVGLFSVDLMYDKARLAKLGGSNISL